MTKYRWRKFSPTIERVSGNWTRKVRAYAINELVTAFGGRPITEGRAKGKSRQQF